MGGPFIKGDAVTIRRVENAKYLNGRKGTLGDWNSKIGEWKVILDAAVDLPDGHQTKRGKNTTRNIILPATQLDFTWPKPDSTPILGRLQGQQPAPQHGSAVHTEGAFRKGDSVIIRARIEVDYQSKGKWHLATHMGQDTRGRYGRPDFIRVIYDDTPDQILSAKKDHVRSVVGLECADELNGMTGTLGHSISQKGQDSVWKWNVTLKTGEKKCLKPANLQRLLTRSDAKKMIIDLLKLRPRPLWQESCGPRDKYEARVHSGIADRLLDELRRKGGLCFDTSYGTWLTVFDNSFGFGGWSWGRGTRWRKLATRLATAIREGNLVL